MGGGTSTAVLTGNGGRPSAHAGTVPGSHLLDQVGLHSGPLLAWHTAGGTLHRLMAGPGVTTLSRSWPMGPQQAFWRGPEVVF